MRSGVIVGLACVLAIGVGAGCDGEKPSKAEGEMSPIAPEKPADAAPVNRPPASPPESPSASEAEARARAKAIVVEITRHLLGVTTRESAEAAATHLAPLAERLQTTMAALKKHASTAGSGDLTRAVHRVVEDVRDLVSGQLRIEVDKMRTEIRRVSANPEWLAPLAVLIGKIEKAVQM